MSVKFIRNILLILVLALVVAACQTRAQTPATTEFVPTSPTVISTVNSGLPDETGYPVQESVLSTESYPAPPPTDDPLSLLADRVEVPTPKEGFSVVTGRILETSTNQPYIAPSLILGELVFGSDPSAPPLVGFSPETDPTAILDRSGGFVFQDVKPGKYAIVVWTPGSQTLLGDSQGNTIQVDVAPGQVVDLGNVYVP